MSVSESVGPQALPELKKQVEKTSCSGQTTRC